MAKKTLSSGPQLAPRQRQGLLVTPQLRQGIEILQYSAIELEQFLSQALAENPFLTEDAPDEAPQSEHPETPDGEFDIFDNENGADFEEDIVFEEDRTPIPDRLSRTGGGYGDDLADLERWAASQKSFYESLQEDIGASIRDPKDRLIAGALAALLDERGYITPENMESLRQKLHINARRLEEVLFVLQKLVPAGIFARDLKECLILQLQERGKMSPLYAHLLDHLEDLGRGHFSKVGRQIGLDVAGIEEALTAIRFLKAHPLKDIEGSQAPTVVPDILVKSRRDGFVVQLNPQVQSRLSLDQDYKVFVARQKSDRAFKKYVQTQAAAAHFIVRAVEQRLQTIFHVAQAIVEEQQAFMREGLEALKPMGLRQVALRVGVHESTVSRAVAGKYMATPVGIFEMRWFFSQKVSTIFGHGGLSQRSVKDQIRQMVAAEDTRNPLSDEALRLKLAEEGIQLARRTVAKYREQENIPPTSRRRRR